jgi:phosphotransferase system  glucose/maltose/N-acetylglucosamine-specific IIC component
MPSIPLPYRKPLLVTVVASAIGFLSMGATGMAVFAAADWLVDRTLAIPLGWARPHGDTVWPTAIMYALAVPWVALGAFLFVRPRLPTQAGRVLAVTTFTAIVMLLVHVLYRAQAR